LNADCHCHTNFSDGSLSPLALLDLAKSEGVQAMSITDHDTVAAYDAAVPYAKSLDITLIPGIEISSEWKKASIHVLGYAFDLNHPTLISFCETLQQRRIQRNEEILGRLSRHGMRTTMEELQARFPDTPSLGRPHIATLLFEKGYVRSPHYAFTRFIGEKCRCYAPGIQMPTPEAIELLHSVGAFAVLAHPHYIKPAKIVDDLSEMPFDGVEAYYGRSMLSQAKPWLDLAEMKGWFATGGSDFHGQKKTGQKLGCAWTPPEVFEKFIQRFSENTALN
jgi:hypothetical protein